MSKKEDLVEKKESRQDNEYVESPKVNFNIMEDAQLMDECFKRGIEIPMDSGKIVRKIAVQKLVKWERAAKPLSAYRKMKVIFHRTGREGEAPYVFLCLNGVAYQVPYEKEVLLPEPVVRSCADDAVREEIEFVGFDAERGSATYRDKKIANVPYTFLGYVEPVKKG